MPRGESLSCAQRASHTPRAPGWVGAGPLSLGEFALVTCTRRAELRWQEAGRLEEPLTVHDAARAIAQINFQITELAQELVSRRYVLGAAVAHHPDRW